MAGRNVLQSAESAEPDSAASGLLAEATEAGGIAAWHWDVESGRLAWSANLDAVRLSFPRSSEVTFEVFGSEIHPEDQDRVLADLRRAAETSDSYKVQCRLPPRADRQISWLEARGRVIRDTSGRPVSLIGVCQDITEHKNLESELDLWARQQEALVHLGERALGGAKPEEIFAETVRLVAELVSADYAEILEISQDRDTLNLRAAHGWGEDMVGQSVASSEPESLAGFTMRALKPVVVNDIGSEARFRLSEMAQAHGVRSGASVTIGGKDGKPFGVLAVYCKHVRCISQTDVRFLQSLANVLGSANRAAQDQERSELLIGELRHRVGNLFSLVQALHRQTGQNAQDAQDLEMKFGGRLAALASAHALILEGGWQKASIRALLETTLAPYRDRVTFTGTDVRMSADAAFSFSMALHELATNANKYGALASPEGRLVIDTRSEPDPLGNKLVLVWNEHDGPPPPEAKSLGFGSKLISQVVERQLSGQVTREVQGDGLKVTIEFPVR
jgi:two-component sensor histidine kinase